MPKSNLAGAGYTVIGAEIVSKARESKEFSERVFGPNIPEKLLYKHWFEILLEVAKGMCGYCAGTIIKCRSYHVNSIESVRLEKVVSHKENVVSHKENVVSHKEETYKYELWCHKVIVHSIMRDGPYEFPDETCLASKLWKVAYERLIQKETV